MGRNWVPKYKVKCRCGWKGIRADIIKPCPKCGFCYPPKENNKAETELKELIDTVVIACNPPDSCEDPNVLKEYMKACLDRAEQAREVLNE